GNAVEGGVLERDDLVDGVESGGDARGQSSAVELAILLVDHECIGRASAAVMCALRCDEQAGVDAEAVERFAAGLPDRTHLVAVVAADGGALDGGHGLDEL